MKQWFGTVKNSILLLLMVGAITVQCAGLAEDFEKAGAEEVGSDIGKTTEDFEVDTVADNTEAIPTTNELQDIGENLTNPRGVNAPKTSSIIENEAKDAENQLNNVPKIPEDLTPEPNPNLTSATDSVSGTDSAKSPLGDTQFSSEDKRKAADDDLKLKKKQLRITQLKELTQVTKRIDQIKEFTETAQARLRSNLDSISNDFQEMDKAGYTAKSINTFKESLLTRLNRVSDLDYAKMLEFENPEEFKQLFTKPGFKDYLTSIEDKSGNENLSIDFDNPSDQIKSALGAYQRKVQRESINKMCKDLSEGDAAAKSAAKTELAKEAINIAVDNACAGEVLLSENIEKDSLLTTSESKEALSENQKALQGALKKEVAKLRTAVGNDISFQDLISDERKMVDDQEVSAIDDDLNKAYKKINSDGELQTLKNKFSSERESLIKTMSFSEKIQSGVIYRDGALAEVGRNLNKYLERDLTHDVADGFTSLQQGLKKIGSKVVGALKHIAETLVSGVLFMIPNIVQSGFLAAKQAMVILQTISTPFQFGDFVFQMASSCINMSNPIESIPLYFAIPVQNVGDQLTLDAFVNADKSVSMNQSSNNHVSSAIRSISKSLFTFGTNLNTQIDRYNVNEGSYLNSPSGAVATTYFAPSGYQLWGSVPATSSQFTSGELILLNNGFAFDGSGSPVSTTGISGFDAFPMLIPKGFDWHGQPPQSPLSPADLKSFYAQMQERLRLSGNNVKYVQYVNVSHGSRGVSGSVGLQSYFDASCLSTSGTTCKQEPTLASVQSKKATSCGLNQLFNNYLTGLSFNADGSVGSRQAPSKSVASQNMLESVQPLFGWGSLSLKDSLLSTVNFPGFSIDLSSYAATQGSDNKMISDPIIQFAPERVNYQAFGCWVYLAYSTPFAQALLQQKGLKQADVGGPYVDYIIFLDINNNVVPLKVPVQKTFIDGKYSMVELTFNPAIKYWTSIAAFNNQTGQALSMFADEETQNPIKYDLEGHAYQDANLAGVFSANSAPGTNVISGAIADLQNNFGRNSTSLGNLYAQFYAHQQAMNSMLVNGPFVYGNIDLILSPTMSIDVAGSSGSIQASMAVYTGSTCYQTGVPDLLIAYNPTKQSFVSLPDSGATMFYSLVTDVGYKVKNGALVPFDFSNAPLNTQGTKLKTAATNNFYWLNAVEQMLESNIPLAKKGQPYISLCNGVACQNGSNSPMAQAKTLREAWVSHFDPSAQKLPMTVGALSFNMPSEFFASKAIAAGAYIYQASPSPSAGLCDKDLFILTNNQAPTLETLQPINANQAHVGSTICVSLMSGFLYDLQGNQLMNSTGAARMLSLPDVGIRFKTATSIYEVLNEKYNFKAIAAESFDNAYAAWAQAFDDSMNRAMGPYTFGSLNLSMRAGDYAAGNYVYFDSASLHHNQMPQDVFVTFNPNTGKTSAMLDRNTQYVVSLVSGNVYDTSGSVVTRIQSSQLLSMVQAASSTWGIQLTDLINDLQKILNDQLIAAEDEQVALDTIFAQIATQHNITLLPADAKEIIARLEPSGNKGLIVPYGLLKYDPITEQFVHVSPIEGKSSFLYLFFNVGTDKKTGKTIGGIYHAGGQCVHVVKDIELEVFSKQYGVQVNQTSGAQTLHIPLTQPPFIMTQDAQDVTLGSNSDDEDLISSQSPFFPGGPVAIKKKYYLYYSSSMQAYFVFDTINQRWISVMPDHEGYGHIYDSNGSPIPLLHSVAIRKKASALSGAPIDDMILLYENADGAMQGIINGQSYVNIALQDTDSMNWINVTGTTNSSLIVTQSSDGNTFIISGMDGVLDNKTVTYVVNSDYAWSYLYAVADQASIMAGINIDNVHKKAQVVTNKGKISHMMYAGSIYKVTAVSEKTYTLQSVQSQTGSTIQVQELTDSYTGAVYFKISDPALSKPINYMYQYQQLTPDQMETYQAIFDGSTAASTWPQPYGSLHSGDAESVTVGNITVEISKPSAKTHVLFAKNIGITASGVADLKQVEPSQVVGVPKKPGVNASEQEKNQYMNFERTAAAFFANIAEVLMTSDGRFFAELPASSNDNAVLPALSYVSNGAYVDLLTGILYSTQNGVSLGYSLNLDDMLTVLDTLHVCVMQTKSKTGAYQFQLLYRTPQVMQTQTAQIESVAQDQDVSLSDVGNQFNSINTQAAA